MAKPPHTGGEMRGLYPDCQVTELAAGYRDTTLRSAWLDLTAIIPATACHQRNYVRDTVGLCYHVRLTSCFISSILLGAGLHRGCLAGPCRRHVGPAGVARERANGRVSRRLAHEVPTIPPGRAVGIFPPVLRFRRRSTSTGEVGGQLPLCDPTTAACCGHKRNSMNRRNRPSLGVALALALVAMCPPPARADIAVDAALCASQSSGTVQLTQSTLVWADSTAVTWHANVSPYCSG